MSPRNGLLNQDGRDALEKYKGLPPEIIAIAEGLVIKDCVFVPNCIRCCMAVKTIFISQSLDRCERDWRLAFCLGHYFTANHNNKEDCLWILFEDGKTNRENGSIQAVIFASELLITREEVSLISR